MSFHPAGVQSCAEKRDISHVRMTAHDHSSGTPGMKPLHTNLLRRAWESRGGQRQRNSREATRAFEAHSPHGSPEVVFQPSAGLYGWQPGGRGWRASVGQ